MIGFLRNRRWLMRAVLAASGIGVIGVAVVLADDVWVNTPVATLRGGPNGMYPVVASVPQGTQLTVVEQKTVGAAVWYHVQYQGQDGWLAQSSLSTRQVGGEEFAGVHDTNSSGTENSNAGKGFTAIDFANSKGYSMVPLTTLEANVKAAVSPDDFEKFMAAGQIGDSKPQ